MSADDLESYESDIELALYREYRDVVGLFQYFVETDRRSYLANDVRITPCNTDSEMYFEVVLQDAWVWDVYRSSRFVRSVRILTYKDVNIEELAKPDLDLSDREGLDMDGPPPSS